MSKFWLWGQHVSKFGCFKVNNSPNFSTFFRFQVKMPNWNQSYVNFKPKKKKSGRFHSTKEIDVTRLSREPAAQNGSFRKTKQLEHFQLISLSLSLSLLLCLYFFFCFFFLFYKQILFSITLFAAGALWDWRNSTACRQERKIHREIDRRMNQYHIRRNCTPDNNQY